uniref:Uncharacterized protein n=1 Tax=Romanomermis culicivorax TaxID=13658 RepID=A0A915JDK8_ROMCU
MLSDEEEVRLLEEEHAREAPVRAFCGERFENSPKYNVRNLDICDQSCSRGNAEYYLSLDQGDDNKVGAGRIGYQLFKMVGYKEQKKTEAKFDVPMQTLIDEIDEWHRQKFISEGEASEQKNALYAMQSNHVIKEVLFDRGQFEMVYGLTGFMRLNGKYASSSRMAVTMMKENLMDNQMQMSMRQRRRKAFKACQPMSQKEVKGTFEALLYKIANATMKDNLTESNNCLQVRDRQVRLFHRKMTI